MRVWPVDEKAVSGGRVTISGPDARHIITVLRKRLNDKLRVSEPGARIFETTIEEIGKDVVIARITSGPIYASLKKPDIILALSICKQSVMELVVQKAVELGCSTFIPLITKRSVGKSISPKKLERLRKIAHEACKQSGRTAPMETGGIATISKLPPADLKIVLWEEEAGQTVASVLALAENPSSVCVLIGPPGGLESGEIEELKESGFKTAGLGPLILRTETASLAMLSIVNYHFGRMDP